MTEKTRGRPKTYDPERALWQALETFWAGGYTATSLDELAAATGMNRPSLYAAFGDKKALYLKTLERFSEELRADMGAALAREERLEEALKAFYQPAIDIYTSGPEGGRGCFIVCTAPAEAAANPDIRAALDGALKEIDRGLEWRFKKAKADGELPKDADPAMLAKIAAATMHSLAIRARAGEPKKSLETLAFQTVRLLCANPARD